MLLTGIVLGPYVLNLLDENILNISSELRKMALIIILMRAGLGLDISGLKENRTSCGNDVFCAGKF